MIKGPYIIKPFYLISSPLPFFICPVIYLSCFHYSLFNQAQYFVFNIHVFLQVQSQALFLRPQHCLYFLPLPHGHGSFGYTLISFL